MGQIALKTAWYSKGPYAGPGPAKPAERDFASLTSDDKSTAWKQKHFFQLFDAVSRGRKEEASPEIKLPSRISARGELENVYWVSKKKKKSNNTE